MSRSIDQRRLRSRKQPSQARSRATVDAVVEATARILESRGHDGFTTNAVAERAGVSIGTLYQYFPDKEALLGAVMARETALLVADAQVAGDEHDATLATTRLIGAAIAHQLRRPALARLLDFEEARTPLDPDLRDVRDRFHVILAGVLSRFDPPPPDVSIATADVAAIIRGMVDAAGERGETDHDALLIRVQWGVFGYLRPRTGSIQVGRS